MSAAPRPTLVDSRRQFWWGEHELIDYGVPARIGTSAWTVYTCLLRHVNAQSVTFPSVKLLMAETGLSNRVIAASITTLKAVHLIEVDRESHQWNVYKVLDVLHAIRTNGWTPIKEARDEKSPAPESPTAPRKHVTKSHLPRDEKSPEQVTKSHPKKNHLKTTKEEGGVSNVVGDAREGAQPSAPVVALPTPAPHTTGEASLSKDAKAVRDQPAGVAVLSPDGEAADAAVTDSDLAFLFGNAGSPQEAQQVESEGEIPGAAALPLPAPPVARVDHLRPVPRDELLERPAAVPADTTYRLVKGLVGGNKAVEDGILDGLTPAGALPRRDWLRLTEEELTEARRVAQAEAQAEKLNFYTCAIRALDVLIGAPVGQTGKRGAPVVAVVANAGCHAPAKHQEAPDWSQDARKYEGGARWREKATGKVLTLVELEIAQNRTAGAGARYRFDDGSSLPALTLMTKYEFEGVEA